MHLLNTNTQRLKYFLTDVPHYAILSHTWGEEEVTFDDIEKPHAPAMKGYQKILKSCAQAMRDGFDWIWIDTCCIDKRSSAELSEAINSMYRWYWEAALCYAYLSDVSYSPRSRIRSSKWFTRGWTLQELLAPAVVEFYAEDWNFLGTKLGLVDDIQGATGIGERYLVNRNAVQSASIGQKFSWVGYRKTTRPEDLAYSLLGLLRINMPLLYGEGRKAFHRLQLELLSTSHDHTIFLWEPPGYNPYDTRERHQYQDVIYGMLAPSPEWFRMIKFSEIENRPSRTDMSLSTHEMTNMGLRFKLPCTPKNQKGVVYAILNCCSPDNQWLAVPLLKRTSGRYKRLINWSIAKCSAKEVREARLLELLAKAESHNDTLEAECGRCRLMIKTVRTWDFPHKLTGLDWVRNFPRGPLLKDCSNPSARTLPYPSFPYDLEQGVELEEDDIGALRIYIGDTTIMTSFSIHQHQPHLAIFLPQHSAHHTPSRSKEYKLELRRIWKLHEDTLAEHPRDYLKVEENGITSAINC